MLRIALPLLSLGLATHATAGGLTPEKGKQIETTVTVRIDSTDVEVPLLLYVPLNYQPDRASVRPPLVLFLHGLGECGQGGDELSRVHKHGPPKQVVEGKLLPFVLVSPQCPPPASDDREVIANAWRADLLLALLDKVQQEMEVDTNRVYLTGLSMGGYGAWRLAAAAPQRFAAVVPICGGGDPTQVGKNVTGLPIWAFHGEKDDLVPIARSAEMADAFQKAGAEARLTCYSDAGHDSWTQTYDNPMFYDWLLGERLDAR